MSYDEHQAMWPQVIAALAAIDAALGLPKDGCNSLAQTLAEINRLRDVAREAADAATKHQAEVLRLRAALKKANDQAEHFERLWYLTNEDAARYAFSKTLEGQVVTMETFKVRGAAALDEAIDDAMAEAADAHNEAGYAA